MDRRARAIERLYQQRYARFHGVLSTIAGSYETGHDAVQETFARALAKRSDFRGENSRGLDLADRYSDCARAPTAND